MCTRRLASQNHNRQTTAEKSPRPVHQAHKQNLFGPRWPLVAFASDAPLLLVDLESVELGLGELQFGRGRCLSFLVVAVLPVVAKSKCSDTSCTADSEQSVELPLLRQLTLSQLERRRFSLLLLRLC